jgi:large subunit ribosomal protein L20
MPKANTRVASRARRKKFMRAAKGFWGNRSRDFKLAKEAVMRAGVYAYRDRKAHKRNIRSLWIVRINAAARAEGITYGKLVPALQKANIILDRKILADLALNAPAVFAKVVEIAKAA